MISYILLLILGIAVLAACWFVVDYNRFVRLYALLQEAWSGVDVQLKRRYDLIPNLVAVVKQYSIHEKSVLEEVTRLRSQAAHATGLEEKISSEAQLSHAIRNLMVVVEQYPQLKANENFISLQRELSTIEHEIQLSRRYYNGTVRNYNIQVSRFPSFVVARVTGFAPAPYFEIDKQERENPRINF